MKRIKKFLSGHARKVGLLTLNFLFNHKLVFKAIGILNKRRPFLKTVFVAYPASEEYASKYVYKRHRHWMRWKPWPAGLFRQDGKWGLMTVISSTEKDFNSSNYENLKYLVEETEKIRKWLGAEQKTFAGVIPGVLYNLKLLDDPVERDVTAEALMRAEKKLREKLSYSEEVPLILLGGKGFIGKRLREKLDRDVYCVDVNSVPNKPNLQEWPRDLEGQDAILINLTRASTISHYTHLFWPGLTLLNEAYPAPEEEAEKIRAKGGNAFHLVGVKANSYPSFPKAYYGGIPCCAAWSSSEMEVILREL